MGTPLFARTMTCSFQISSPRPLGEGSGVRATTARGMVFPGCVVNIACGFANRKWWILQSHRGDVLLSDGAGLGDLAAQAAFALARLRAVQVLLSRLVADQ